MEDLIADFGKPRQYKGLYPATDGELREALETYGGFESTAFERIGRNVAIADGAIVVALKLQPAGVNTLYVIDGQELPLQGYRYDQISCKVWATPEVLADVRQAEQTLLAQLRINR